LVDFDSVDSLVVCSEKIFGEAVLMDNLEDPFVSTNPQCLHRERLAWTQSKVLAGITVVGN